MFNGLKNTIGLINTWLSIGKLQDIILDNKFIKRIFSIEDLCLSKTFFLFYNFF